MIVEKLVAYAQHAVQPDGEPLLADPAFPTGQNVDYLITVDGDGRCLSVAPTGTTVKKRRVPKRYRIPAVGDRASEKQAGLLCDGASYIFGAGPWSGRQQRRHVSHAQTFRAVLEKAIQAVPDDEALRAVYRFYERYGARFEALLRDYGYWTKSAPRSQQASSIFKASDRLAFVLAKDNGRPAFERPALQSYWRHVVNERADGKAAGTPPTTCIGCGEESAPVKNHERTIKIPMHQRRVKLISFDKKAFCSHGSVQSLNAPVCQGCADAYTLALNELLGENRSTNYIDREAGIAYVFWTRSAIQFDLNAAYIKADPEAVENLYRSIQSPRHARAIIEQEANDFYVLALGASGARAIVRDWIETHLDAVVRNIAKWYQDLTVCLDRPWPRKSDARGVTGERFGQFPLAYLCRGIARKVERGWDVPPELSSALFSAGLAGRALSPEFLAAALRRVRADHDIAPHRAALIRLVLNRLIRSRNRGDREMPEENDPLNPDPAYVCGRLLAVLERIQRRALGDVNATIIDRYFGAASTAPRPIFTVLVKRAENHLGKLRRENPGAAQNLQKDLEAVIAHIGDPDAWRGDLPPWLDLEGQGRFAIGFYHQRAEYRKKPVVPKAPATGESE